MRNLTWEAEFLFKEIGGDDRRLVRGSGSVPERSESETNCFARHASPIKKKPKFPALPARWQFLAWLWVAERLGRAAADFLGPSILKRIEQFPEIPDIFNGPPERIASYLNEINSSMRVSACFCVFRVSACSTFIYKGNGERNAQIKLLAHEKSYDRLYPDCRACLPSSGDLTGFRVRRAAVLTWEVSRKWAWFF